MSEALMPTVARPEITRPGGAVVLPAVIVDAGPAAVEPLPGVLRGADREREDAGGVRAGRGAVSGVVRGPTPSASPPSRRSTSRPTSGPTRGRPPTVKQHLAAIRMLCDWLVVSQVLPANPAAAVRGPKHVVTKGSTPVLIPAEARKLLEHIDTGTLAGLRDRALFSVMLYSFARVSAVLGMRRQDYFEQGSREWLRLHEKGGKRHDVPAHHRAAEALRRLPRGQRARGRAGGAISERGPGGG